METIAVIGCATLVWIALFVLTSGDGAGWRALPARRLSRYVFKVLILVTDALAATWFVSWLVGRESVGALCAAVVEREEAQGRHEVTEERACSELLLMAATISLLCALATHSLFAALVVPIALVAGVPAWGASRRRRLAQELSATMPGVFRALAMAMGSGETLSQAIEYVGVHEEGPAGRAFMRAALRMRCGSSAEEALDHLSGELKAPGVELLVTALLISQRTGSPLRGLFEYSAGLVERAREFERMLAVKTAQVRLSVRVVCLLPVVMLFGLSLISPDFRGGLMTAPGMASVGIAAAMDLTALVIIRRIMRGVL